MMKHKVETLSKRHNAIIEAFLCVETNEILSTYNSKERRTIIRHSKEMDDFLKKEALVEQNKGLSTTHLLIDKDNNKLIGFISLCNDCLSLDIDEKNKMNMPYLTIPAVKIARLGIDNNYQGQSLGKFLIGYSTILISHIKKYSGVTMVTLDCYKDKIAYYQKLGFKFNSLQPKQLEYDSLTSMRITVEELANIITKWSELL